MSFERITVTICISDRYYDYDKDGYLNVLEFKQMIKDMCTILQQRLPEHISTEMQKIGITSINGREFIEYASFKRAVGGHVFRGTSKLCRATKSPFLQITKHLVTKHLYRALTDADLRCWIQNKRFNGHCVRCANGTPYEVASTLIYLNKAGHCSGSQQLFQASHLHKSISFVFTSNLKLKFLMNKIREFNKTKGTFRVFRGLFQDVGVNQMQMFYENIRDICNEVAKLLESEDRVLRVQDPCYVIGDIHGNLEDLLTLEDKLWKSVPLLTCNYLFLGDYVDRGKWGFECFLYLMILKLIAPNKVFLLRGNHEIRAIQIKYSFHKELIRKYGNTFGSRIFELYNAVFDRLPFCAVIRSQIFCCHGGIPYTIKDLNTLELETPRVCKEPEAEAIWQWEILWSDPLDYNKFGETAEILGMSPDAYGGGYLPNLKRGTSFVFNEYAIESFFKLNNLSYVIRAHEVPAEGFRFNFGTLCTTIFSCSHYCGADNESATILVPQESRIRIIRIDTSNNAPATGS